jgi:hypothetical protein
MRYMQHSCHTSPADSLVTITPPGSDTRSSSTTFVIDNTALPESRTVMQPSPRAAIAPVVSRVAVAVAAVPVVKMCRSAWS